MHPTRTHHTPSPSSPTGLHSLSMSAITSWLETAHSGRFRIYSSSFTNLQIDGNFLVDFGASLVDVIPQMTHDDASAILTGLFVAANNGYTHSQSSSPLPSHRRRHSQPQPHLFSQSFPKKMKSPNDHDDNTKKRNRKRRKSVMGSISQNDDEMNNTHDFQRRKNDDEFFDLWKQSKFSSSTRTKKKKNKNGRFQMYSSLNGFSTEPSSSSSSSSSSSRILNHRFSSSPSSFSSSSPSLTSSNHSSRSSSFSFPSSTSSTLSHHRSTKYSSSSSSSCSLTSSSHSCPSIRVTWKNSSLIPATDIISKYFSQFGEIFSCHVSSIFNSPNNKKNSSSSSSRMEMCHILTYKSMMSLQSLCRRGKTHWICVHGDTYNQATMSFIFDDDDDDDSDHDESHEMRVTRKMKRIQRICDECDELIWKTLGKNWENLMDGNEEKNKTDDLNLMKTERRKNKTKKKNENELIDDAREELNGFSLPINLPPLPDVSKEKDTKSESMVCESVEEKNVVVDEVGDGESDDGDELSSMDEMRDMMDSMRCMMNFQHEMLMRCVCEIEKEKSMIDGMIEWHDMNPKSGNSFVKRKLKKLKSELRERQKHILNGKWNVLGE